MMINNIYKCLICGNIVEVIHVGGGQLVCCGKPMEFIQPNTVEASFEKHIPVLKLFDNKAIIKIGETKHPMTEEHFVEWVEVITENSVYRKVFSPNEEPEIEFNINEKIFEVRAYCNLHGLWATS